MDALMELHNEFTVAGQPDEVFELLLDLEQVAACVPGATLRGRDGDEYRGTVKLKLGPVAAAYDGSVAIAEVDRASRSATLKASGRELDGQGGVEATVRATVHGNGGARVTVASDVELRDKAGQLGPGVLSDVAQRLMDQLAANLEARLVAAQDPTVAQPAAAGAAAAVAPEHTPVESGAQSLAVPPVEAEPMLLKAAPALAAFILGVVVGLLVRGRRSDRLIGGG